MSSILDELYDRTSELYYDIARLDGFSSNIGSYINDTDNFVNEIYRETIANICDIDKDEITYEMIELARGYTVQDDTSGYRNVRHLTDDELRKEINLIRGVNNKTVNAPKDKIGKLYDAIGNHMSKLRELGLVEDEVFDYMAEITLGIFKNTISGITLINPESIPDSFARDIASCIKKDKDNNIIVERYTDAEIILKAKEEGLYAKAVNELSKDNEEMLGEVERLDRACQSHYDAVAKIGIDDKNVVEFTNDLTNELYKEMLSYVFMDDRNNIDDELVKIIRRGKIDKNGKRRSYNDNEAKLLYAYQRSKQK